MQVVSGPDYKRKVHFEAPASKIMQREMTHFIGWFNNTAPGAGGSFTRVNRASASLISIPSASIRSKMAMAVLRGASPRKSCRSRLASRLLIALSQVIEKQRKT